MEREAVRKIVKQVAQDACGHCPDYRKCEECAYFYEQDLTALADQLHTLLFTTHHCQRCGTAFPTGTHKGKRYCDTCRPRYVERLCRQCGSVTQGKNHYCPTCREGKADRMCAKCGTRVSGRNWYCAACRLAKKNEQNKKVREYQRQYYHTVTKAKREQARPQHVCACGTVIDSHRTYCDVCDPHKPKLPPLEVRLCKDCGRRLLDLDPTCSNARKQCDDCRIIKRRAKQQRYDVSHSDKRHAAMRKYYAEHRERILEYQRRKRA